MHLTRSDANASPSIQRMLRTPALSTGELHVASAHHHPELFWSSVPDDCHTPHSLGTDIILEEERYNHISTAERVNGNCNMSANTRCRPLSFWDAASLTDSRIPPSRVMNSLDRRRGQSRCFFGQGKAVFPTQAITLAPEREPSIIHEILRAGRMSAEPLSERVRTAVAIKSTARWSTGRDAYSGDAKKLDTLLWTERRLPYPHNVPAAVRD